MLPSLFATGTCCVCASKTEGLLLGEHRAAHRYAQAVARTAETVPQGHPVMDTDCVTAKLVEGAHMHLGLAGPPTKSRAANIAVNCAGIRRTLAEQGFAHSEEASSGLGTGLMHVQVEK